MAERLGDEAVHGRRVRLPLGVQKRRGIVDRHLSRKADAAVGQRFRNRLAGFEFVADVAEQLGQHVFERDQPGRAAELIDDERLVRAPLAQVAQHAVGGHALVHAWRSAG